MKQYQVFELAFPVAGPDNISDRNDISAIFSNGSETVKVNGFYDGDGVFKVRFLPRHGIYGVGRTMDETFGLIETVEKAAQIYVLTAHMPRINTIRDDQMVELAEFFGANYRKDFLDI